MKNLKHYLSLAGLAIVLTFAGCNQANQKITSIPITSSSADAKATLQQGIDALYVNDFQQARNSFIKAISQDPKLSIAYVFKSFTNESPKEFAEDLNNAKANLEGVSDYERMYYEMAATFLNNDWNKRLEVAQQIATKYPDVASAQVDLGTTYFGGNQDAKARECFEKAVQINPNWAGGYEALVSSYIFTDPKDFKKAEDNAAKAIELAPASAGAEIAMGDCYRAENSLEKARDAYAKAITLDPNVSEPYYKEGHANTFLGKYDDARQNYTEGAKHDETKFGAAQFIANTYLYNGDYNAALNYLTQEISKTDASGNSPDKIATAKMALLDNCANIAMYNNDNAKLKEAIAAMQPISEQMGNDVGTNEAKLTQKGIMLYWQALSDAMDQNYGDAKTAAEQIKTTLDPIKDPTKLNNYEFAMGYIAMKQNNYPEAVSHFGKTTPDITYNKYWLAMANLGAGNKDIASTLLKQVSDYDFNEIGYALVRNDAKNKLASL